MKTSTGRFVTDFVAALSEVRPLDRSDIEAAKNRYTRMASIEARLARETKLTAQALEIWNEVVR